ncbi:MAG: C-terminal binding protein [Pirellulales bacterium]
MKESFRVVVTDVLTDDLGIERGVLADVADVDSLGAQCEGDLVGRIEDADAIMLYHKVTISASIIERLKHCRLIVRCGVGYDNVDIAAARQRGIPVANVPDYGSEEVADTAIGMMLSLARGIGQLNSLLRSAAAPWEHTPVAPLARLRGRGFGVVGLGRIGSAVALRAKAIGMDVVYYDPYKEDGYDKALGIRRVGSMEALLEASYALSLHCPLTDATRRMIDRSAIDRMPRRALLINTARGEIVDTASLPDAIAEGQLGGAAIDVLPTEPPAEDDPLIRAWRDPGHPAYHRLLVNSHAAFYSEEGIVEMRSKSAQACRRALLGQALSNVVN